MHSKDTHGTAASRHVHFLKSYYAVLRPKSPLPSPGHCRLFVVVREMLKNKPNTHGTKGVEDLIRRSLGSCRFRSSPRLLPVAGDPCRPIGSSRLFYMYYRKIANIDLQRCEHKCLTNYGTIKPSRFVQEKRQS